MPERMIILKQVSVGYGKYRAGKPAEEALVVKDVSFEIGQGRSVCLVGPNGSGKTTLLRAIAGMLPAYGEILVDGKNLREIKRKEIASYLSFLSQMSRVYYSFSVYETVMQGRYVHGGSFFSQTASRDRDVIFEEIRGIVTDELKKRGMQG